jgi:hypothetical protein
MKKRTAAGLCLPLLIVGLACGPERRPSVENQDVPIATEGINVVLRLTADRAEILSVSRLESPPRHLPSSQRITPSTWERFPPSSWELVARFQDAEGRPLDGHSYGWSARPMMFDAMPPPRRPKPGKPIPDSRAAFDGAAGGPVYDDRLLTLPLPQGAATLAFFRIGVRIGSLELRKAPEAGVLVGALERVDPREGTIVVEEFFLAAYPLTDPGRGLGLLPQFPAPERPRPAFFSVDPKRMRALDFLEASKAGSETKALRNVGAGLPDCGHGSVVGFRTFRSSGSPKDMFDIVITGDGFDSQELVEFNTAAELLANGLLGVRPMPGVAPFWTLRDKINVHIIEVVSTDSETENCGGTTAPKDTYFGVSGIVGNSAFETPCLAFIHQAAKTLLGNRVDHYEVMIIIANCPHDGGRGKFHSRIALVPNLANPDDFLDLAAHELAHAIVGVVDEYISGMPWACRDRMQRYCNLATRQQLWNQSVWWKSQFPNPGGGFPVRDAQFDANGCPGDPDCTQPGEVGAFWGCQFIDWTPTVQGCGFDPALEEPQPCCYPPSFCPQCSDDPRATEYFRPMCECRMLYRDLEFCKVCRHELKSAITEARRGPSQECKQGVPLP